jgi:lipoprotein-anchoring transpeptidase ErfK/SrfK
MLRAVSAIALACVLAVVTACSSKNNGLWKSGDDKPKGPQTTATITNPKADAKDVPASQEIEYKTENATSATFELKDASGKAVDGALRPGSTTWVPSAALAYNTTYTATVTATASDGKVTTGSSTFTTMAKPANGVRVSSTIGDDAVVGVGMPMVLQFDRAIPKDLRDDVQRRLWVTSTPAQEGSWRWLNDRELHYRPKKFWQPGTKLSFRVGTGGMPLGNGYYGRADLTVVASVRPDSVVLTINNATHSMTVTKNGKTIKTIPVSLGRPSMPSSSGTTVIMEKLRNTVFDTRNDPNPENRYLTPVEYAQRLTWGGEFIHAAPWSEAQQGHTNVSHGCVNVSQANATWLYGLTMVGDPVITKGTGRALQDGNGWTDWMLSWDEYVKGSAIPYTPPAPTAEPSPSTTATP